MRKLLFLLFAIGASSSISAQELTVSKMQHIIDQLASKPVDEYQIIENYTESLGKMELISAVLFCKNSICACGESASSFKRSYGLRRSDGVVLVPVFDRILDWNNNYLVQLSCNLSDEEAEEWGLENSYGNHWMIELDDKFNVVQLHQEADWDGNYFIVEQDGKYGVLSNAMNITVKCEYDQLTGFSMDKEYFFDYPYEEWSEYLESMAAKKDGKWAILTRNGSVMIPFKYDSLTNLDKGKSIASLDNKWGMIDKYDSIIVPFDYDLVERAGWSYILKKEGKAAIMSHELEHDRLKFIYDDANYTSNGVQFLKKGKLWYPYYHERLMERGFPSIVDGNDNYILVGKKNNYAVMDRYRKIKTDFVYSSIVGVEYKRGEDLTEDGHLIRSYPIYEITLMRGNKEETLIWGD